ncbi:MAG: histone [Candidatus Nanohaloarchaea archaeon]
MEFTTPKMKETIKKQTSKRVSEDAANSLGDILETFAGDVAEEAKAIAEEDGRKTVRREDIRQALE